MKIFQNPYPQQFSVPYPIIKYIISNPTLPTAWKKLIQTCKHFYSKNSALPIKRLRKYGDTKWLADDGVFDDVNDIRCKLWLYDELDVCSHKMGKRMLCLIPKIYKCDLSVLNLWLEHDLIWDDYQILAASGTFEKLILFVSHIRYSNGDIVTFDKFFENIKHVKEFRLVCFNNILLFPPGTMKKIDQVLSRFKMLQNVIFNGLPDSFDLFSFFSFFKKSETTKIWFSHYTSVELSDAYKEKCDKFVDELIANPPKIMPYIYYLSFAGARRDEFKKVYGNDFRHGVVL